MDSKALNAVYTFRIGALVSAWRTFARMLEIVDQYQTKAAFHGWLEDLKMSVP